FVQLLRCYSEVSDQVAGLRTLEFNLAARLPFHEIVVALHVNGAQRWLSMSGGPLFDERNQFIGYSGIAIDVVGGREAESQTRQLAHFDARTGLANRAHFFETLDELLKRSRQKHSTCTLFFVDLDRFKIVNDTLGHPVG